MKTKDDDDAASAKRWRELKLERVRQRHDILEDQGETSIDIAENDVSIHTLSKETSTKANSAVRSLFFLWLTCTRLVQPQHANHKMFLFA